VDARVGARRHRAGPGDADVEAVVVLDEIPQRGQLDELTSAPPAVVQEARGAAVEHGERLMAFGAGERAVARSRLEAEVAPAARAVGGVARVHVEAARAPDRGDRGVAVGTSARSLQHAGAADRADEGARGGHCTEA